MNTASGKYTSVSGGGSNKAVGEGSSVSGEKNIKNDYGGYWAEPSEYSSVLGGGSNTAEEDYSSISGGTSNL
jgi:hypothetical protein